MSSFRDRPLQVDGTAVEMIQALKLEPRIMRYELSDYEWTAIKPMLPNKPRGVQRVNDRRVLNGIFWVLRSGAPWRDLPALSSLELRLALFHKRTAALAIIL